MYFRRARALGVLPLSATRNPCPAIVAAPLYSALALLLPPRRGAPRFSQRNAIVAPSLLGGGSVLRTDCHVCCQIGTVKANQGGAFAPGRVELSAKLRRRLQQLERAAEAGNAGAAGEARLLRAYLDDEDQATRKRQDDRVKVLIGAYTASELAAGRRPSLDDPSALLAALDGWLVRPAERLAVLGSDGTGSPALRRVLGR